MKSGLRLLFLGSTKECYMWMKRISFLAIGVLALGAQEPAAQNAEEKLASTRLGQHLIGETLQEWLALEHILDHLDTFCRSHKRQDKKECRRLLDIRDGKQNVFINGSFDIHQYTWKFSDGKLSEALVFVPGASTGNSVRPNIQEEFGFLIQKYGPPTSTLKVPYQNSYGARWECLELSWNMPDDTLITASEHPGSLNSWGERKDELTVTFLSKEWQESRKRQQQINQNPYGR